MKQVFLFSLLVCVPMLSCTLSPIDLTGGSTSTPNEVVMGYAVFPNGVPAARTIVQLIPSSYAAIGSVQQPSLKTDTTDESGAYRFTHVDTGIYNIQSVHCDTRTRALITGIAVDTDTVIAPSTVLQPTGNLRIIVSEPLETANGYLFIPGTTLSVFFDGERDTLVLDSVPAGIIPGVYVAAASGSGRTVLRYTIPVSSGETVTIANLRWKFSRRLRLNTTAAAAAVAGNVMGFPILIRLTYMNFAFSEAQSYGEDLMFVKSDNAFLSHEIERWDPVTGHAEVWVKIDTIRGNDSMQYITMYWGNPDAADHSNGAAVFDTARGFQGVWHLSEAGSAIAKDATGNHFDGTPSDTAPADAAGAIGQCRSFNGSSNGIRIHNTADGKLNYGENGTYTMSAWVYADTLDNKFHSIAGKGNEQYFLGLKRSLPDTTMRWEFVEYHDKEGWQITQEFPSAKIWTYLAGVRRGNIQYLYVNGVLADSTIEVTPPIASRNTGDDVTIGRFLSVSAYTMEGKCPFLGKIDEVRIADIAHSADWTKLCYMNQKEQDALVKW
jgi:hypothetical protein